MWSGACFANVCEAEPPRRRRFVQLDSGAADDRHALSPVPCRSQGRQARVRRRRAWHGCKEGPWCVFPGSFYMDCSQSAKCRKIGA